MMITFDLVKIRIWVLILIIERITFIVENLFADATVIATTAFVSPYHTDYDSICAAGIPFIEVFVDVPLKTT
ncbi:unnamed protein product [Rhizopus stolonifer]